MTAVTVVVPYRPDGSHRDAAWAWVRRRWEQTHPGWPVIEGHCPDGPWRKGAAVADAAAKTDAPVLVVSDADVWTDGIEAAVDAVHGGAPWAVPHGRVYRLTERATARVYDGADPAEAVEKVDGLDRKPYTGVEGGGIVVLPADTLARVPMDPRFEVWGQDDLSWSLALSTLAGRRFRGVAPLFHLHHPPAPRLNAHVGNAAGHALHVRYQYASGDRAQMRRLLAEIPNGG